MKKIFVIFLSIITLSSGMILGGCSMINSRSEQEEMIQIVESKKMKNVIEEGLKKIDPQALTPEGKIKSYEIDKKSLAQNPMGGLMFDLIINGDEELTLGYVITEDENGKFHRDGTVWSPKLTELMDGENEHGTK
ncbi:DUF1310 domain-containing protein [Streptococcus sanguinis]|nr:DUF1310 family protein [Streptococcus sanguinis]ETD09870.1 hypothetical protein HMPREF1196_00276 [Streptococcus sanguinis CC94A]MCY7039054.1 DUF1310 domain-containing protein [Streptococcus sanguinis]RRC92267.1 DUF1310 family protein [Streptococcus sanguinis]